MTHTTRIKEDLVEQLNILIRHRAQSLELDHAFVREHAWAICQLCDELISLGAESEPSSRVTPGC